MRRLEAAFRAFERKPLGQGKEKKNLKKPHPKKKNPVEENLKVGEAIIRKPEVLENGTIVFLKMRSDGKIVKVIIPKDGSSVVELENWSSQK